MTLSGGSALSAGKSIFGATGKLSALSHSKYKSLSNVSSSAPRETFQVSEGLFCYDGGMTQIQQTYTIKAPIQRIWQALTDAEVAEQWGAAPAKVDPREGGEFSYWDGDIHGVYTKLVTHELIEQDWYGHDHPERKFKALFTFEESDNTTTVHLMFSGDIEDEQKDIRDWQEYYFDPIKELLEADDV